MKKFIFLVVSASMPMLMAMQKQEEKDLIINFAINPLAEQIEKEQAAKTTSMLCTETTDPLNETVKYALAKLIPIKNRLFTNIVDICPLKYANEYRVREYLLKAFGENIHIRQIVAPQPDSKGPIEFNYPEINVVTSLYGLQFLKNKYKKQLFKDVAKKLTPESEGQLLFSISAKPHRHHPMIVAFKKLQATEPAYSCYLPYADLLKGYYYITEDKAKEYLEDAELTPIEITPYTRSIIFKDAEIFKSWLYSWMPLLPALSKVPADKMIPLIGKLGDIFLQDNPPGLDKIVNYTYPHILIHAKK